MPRSVLDARLQRMRTLQVYITKTTEEEIWTHMLQVSTGFAGKINKFRHILSSLVDEYDTDKGNNYFSKYSAEDWRTNRVIRKYTAPVSLCVEAVLIPKLNWVPDDNVREFDFMSRLAWDIQLCQKVFPEWKEKPEFVDMTEDVDMWKGAFDTTLLTSFETLAYNEARNAWMDADAEWLKKKRHNNTHFSRETFATDEQLCSAFDRKYPYDNCKWCSPVRKEYVPPVHVVDTEAERFKQQWAVEKAERELSRERCTECSFTTCDADIWEAHLESREHKAKMNLKRWKCDACDTQSISEPHYQAHLTTSKHKAKITGSVELTEYKCVPCGYSTFIKQNFQKHELTQGHRSKV